MSAALEPLPLPPGIRSRIVRGANGLDIHVLEAGADDAQRPVVLLLHGFPELAYSWRKVMLPIAAAGYRVIAPDQRGYGRTTGWDSRFDGDLRSFSVLNLVRDALSLLRALGVPSVEAVVGHDFGSPIAAWCALIRPDVFRAVALMSATFAGPPALPAGAAQQAGAGKPEQAPISSLSDPRLAQVLAALDPPRKHYQWYYSTPSADADMRHCAQGLHAFLRAYYHHKSADWKANRPHPLAGWRAEEFAKMPTYYVMELDNDMAQTVACEMPSAGEIAACAWLPDDELRVYSSEYARTGFQGGLQWYRTVTGGVVNADLQVFAGRSIDVPSCFIAGASDWGPYQKPGEIDRMQGAGCTRMSGCHFIDGAGHWVQQEKPQETSRLLIEFLRSLR